jgi:hypothetical protein
VPNEVLITVKARNDTKPVFDAIRRDAAALGDEVGADVTTRINERIEREARSGSAYARAGDAIGDSIGRRISERVNERVRVDVNGRLRDERGRFVGGARAEKINVDVDRESFLSKLSSLGKDAAGKFTSIFGTAISGFFSGDVISLILKSLAAGGLAISLSGVIGGAVSSGIPGWRGDRGRRGGCLQGSGGEGGLR